MQVENQHSAEERAARVFRRIEQANDNIAEELNHLQEYLRPLLMPGEIAALFDEKDVNNPLTHLKILRKNLDSFEKAVHRLRLSKAIRFNPRYTKYADLSDREAAGLARLNAELVKVTDHIHEVAKRVSTDLSTLEAQSCNRLWDFEVAAHINFIMHKDDPGYRDDSDNFIASLEKELLRDREKLGRRTLRGDDWPEGGEFCSMPHGPLFHQLYKFGSPKKNSIDFRELLRIGAIWVEVVVRHQYYYDLIEGRWIKSWKGEDEAYRPAYAQEPSRA